MTSARSSHAPTPKVQFIAAFERETAITVRVLRAYPDDKLDLRPHPKSKSARELAWLLVREQRMLATALGPGFDWSKPMPASPEPPASVSAIAAALEADHGKVLDMLRASDDEELVRPVTFFTAPRTMGDMPMRDFLWFMLFDQIHHRGQLSVYLRLADARVPSIYGPTADEPWH